MKILVNKMPIESQDCLFIDHSFRAEYGGYITTYICKFNHRDCSIKECIYLSEVE